MVRLNRSISYLQIWYSSIDKAKNDCYNMEHIRQGRLYPGSSLSDKVALFYVIEYSWGKKMKKEKENENV